MILLGTVVWAQSPAIDQESTFKLNVNVDLVELHVTVLDDLERPVGGLKEEQFRVFEDGTEQSIAVFKHEDIPVSLGLVIDNSRSIEPRKARLDASALTFVRHSNPTDEAFVVHFDFDARVAQKFTSRLKDLETALSSVKPYGQTAIYDALTVALDEMEHSSHQKKAILLITDGIDNASKTSLEELIERVKRSRVAIYPVGLLSEGGGIEAEQQLIRIAEASGGKAYFPEDVDQAHTMMTRIARDLREQYTIGYFPSNPNRNGRWRSVRVDITPPPGLAARLQTNYRYGYYSPDR